MKGGFWWKGVEKLVCVLILNMACASLLGAGVLHAARTAWSAQAPVPAAFASHRLLNGQVHLQCTLNECLHRSAQLLRTLHTHRTGPYALYSFSRSARFATNPLVKIAWALLRSVHIHSAAVECHVLQTVWNDGRISCAQLLVHPTHLPKLQDAKHRVLDHGAGYGQGTEDVLPDGGHGRVRPLYPNIPRHFIPLVHVLWVGGSRNYTHRTLLDCLADCIFLYFYGRNLVRIKTKGKAEYWSGVCVAFCVLACAEHTMLACQVAEEGCIRLFA